LTESSEDRTEREWVQRARRGEAEAWEQLVLVYQQPVFRLAYLLLGDPDDAADVAQETFLRAYDALDRFDPGRPLRLWLLRITTNLTHNWRRSAGRSLAALQRLLRSEPDLLREPAARQQAERNLEADLLWEAVRRLRLADQQVIYLRYFLECSETEMAEVLRTAPGTVKSRLHRALERLRSLLSREYPHLIQEGWDVVS
jgi:RNA polymerase sigma-70 factor (ECF subfamily)